MENNNEQTNGQTSTSTSGDNKVNAAREYNKHVKEFEYYKSLPIANFSQSVWDEMNDLFMGDQQC